jgi:hypothetical protein
MRASRYLLFVTTLLCCLVVKTFAQDKPLKKKELTPILELADKNQIRERIKYLADDKLRGRMPGTPGYQMALDFIIKELTQLGVKPKGETGFIQNVIFSKGKIDTTQSELKLVYADGEKKLRYGKDFTFVPDLNKQVASAEGNVVYVGYGITAPHLNYDDYQTVDVKGKIVLVKEGTPQDFPAGERAHFSLVLSKCEAASKAGASGVILIASGNETLRMGTLSKSSMDGLIGFKQADGKGFSTRSNLYENIKFLAYMKASAFNDLIKENKSQELGIKVSAKATTILSESKSENIVGIIEGTDSKLKDEYVVHTAHLDHLGVGTPVKGDSIYNGAHDNASGTSCLVEIAKLYTKAKLKRSVLIVFVTSEEKGLLGSGYFASNPTVPKDKIVADVNTDMPTLIAPLLSIEPLGAKHSSLMNQVTKAANYLNLDIMEDHIPEQVRFTRSDQYSFIRQGIPALHVKYGLKTNDPSFDLRKRIDDWTAENYHKPSDEFIEASFNFDAAVTYVRLNFLIGWQVANDPKRPEWNKDDFFGNTFGKK